MQYNELKSKIQTAVDSFKGQLAFGTGTAEQLNADDNLVYPIVWMLPPSVSNPIAPNGVQLQGWRFTIRVLQTSSVEQTRAKDDELFNETFAIAQGLVRKLYNTFNDEESYDNLQVGELTQVFRQNDSVHIGWSVPMTINSATDNECCELFE